MTVHIVHEQRYLRNDGRIKTLCGRFSGSSSTVLDDGEGMEVMKSSSKNLWHGNGRSTSVTGVNQEPFSIDVEKQNKKNDQKQGDDSGEQDVAVVGENTAEEISQ